MAAATISVIIKVKQEIILDSFKVSQKQTLSQAKRCGGTQTRLLLAKRRQ